MSRNLYDVTDVRTDKILFCRAVTERGAGQDRIIGQTCLSICTKLFHLQGDISNFGQRGKDLAR